MMQELLIIYGVLGVITLAAQYFLYQTDAKSSFYYLNLAIALVLAFIAFTSFPSNDTILKLLAVVFALIGLAAIYFKSTSDQPMLPKIMLTISILASFALLFF